MTVEEVLNMIETASGYTVINTNDRLPEEFTNTAEALKHSKRLEKEVAEVTVRFYKDRKTVSIETK